MPSEFRMTHRVEFAMTDLAGIMHFSNYYRLMEVTEHAFFRSLGFSIFMEKDGKKIGWPRIHASCNFLAPLKFEDEVEVRLTVSEKGRSSITYHCTFWRLGAGEPLLTAEGTVKAVCVAFDHQTQRMKAIAIPDAIRDKIEVVPHPAGVEALP